MTIQGKVFKYGDNVNTDVIIPARHMNVSDPEALASHCMEDIDPDFVSKVNKGDIIVGGKNFGCGSSREHAPIAIKAAGISCVIAESFARIFYRNSINIGLPILECPEAAQALENCEIITVDLETGTVENKDTGKIWRAEPFPPFMREIIEAGGLMERTLCTLK